MKKTLIFSLGLLSAYPFIGYAEDLSSAFLLDNQPLPVVLTASRLKQPKTEVPASVTIIEAAQIEAWGARTITDLLRFVPGMFVGQSQKENTEAVVYHASTQNLSRRMQVLVDGRSIFKAAIARVVWDDLPIAVEDIARIEVIRGPSSAIYGANALMATVNIITKSPVDTLGTRVAYRAGNQDVEDAFFSHSALIGEGSIRLSANYTSSDGFDGFAGRSTKKEDNWDDDKRNQQFALVYERPLSDQVQLRVDAGVVHNHADITNSNSQHETQYRQADLLNFGSKLKFDFSPTHKSHLQMYWQREVRDHDKRMRLFSIYFDPNLAALYQSQPDKTHQLALLLDQFNRADPSEKPALQAQILSIVASLPAQDQATFAAVQQALVAHDSERIYGTFNYDYTEQRVDVEWQDTVIWHDRLRTVSGVSLRYDEVYSEVFFNQGYRDNLIYRAFLNLEWRILDNLLFNAGGMYEKEELNEEAISPRAALNFLITPQQALRLVYSQAVRSPDMLEQQPDIYAVARNLSANYLGKQEAVFFQRQYSDGRGLKHEKIESVELGYYANLPSLKLEWDIKLYQDELYHLISGDPTNIDEMHINSDSRMRIRGVEMQSTWQPSVNNWIWFTASYMDVDLTLRLDNPKNHCIETCLSPQYSGVLSWQYKGNSWSSTLSYFHLDSLADNTALYQRTEWQLRKSWKIKKATPWVGLFWQHQLSHQPLGYDTQYYESRDNYYAQFGVNF